MSIRKASWRSPWISLRSSLHLAVLVLTLAITPLAAAAEDHASTYDEQSVIKDATEFFGETSEGLAKVIEKAFKDHGRPTGYVKGEEIGGAVALGLRYGDGILTLKNGTTARVYWQGPSLGFDLGANAPKVFILVYGLPNADDIYQRFPAVDGSLYYVAGAGINFQQWKHVILAPIRLGVGWRAGASIGYTHYTRVKTLNPL